jgi:hypothetical protein
VALSCSSTLGTDAGRGGSGGGSTDGQACQPSSVTFRLEASDAAAWFVYDSGQDCTPPGWLSLRDAAGSEIAIGHTTLHCCTLAECGTCQFDVVCQNAWTTPPLPVSRSWDGTMFPVAHCGANQTACAMKSACAPAGRYEAHMCARRIVNDQDQMTCVDVPFDLPAAGPVVGTVSP